MVTRVQTHEEDFFRFELLRKEEIRGKVKARYKGEQDLTPGSLPMTLTFSPVSSFPSSALSGLT